MTSIFWNEYARAVLGEVPQAPAIGHATRLPGPFHVSELLAESMALVGVALARLTGRDPGGVRVEGRLSDLWADTSCTPLDWTPPAPWDPLSGIFEGADGWLRLHTNAPHHKAAALSVLGASDDRDEAAARIRARPVAALEAEILAAGGAAAMLMSPQQWRAHPQGRAVAAEPLVHWDRKPAEAAPRLRRARYDGPRPLAGLKVLDLTRVLAGPVATRALAGFGARVLRVDPPGWDDPGLLQDTTLGKARAGLDLREAGARAALDALLAEADVLVHGYRPGALAALGYGPARLAALNPGLIEASLSAYGWSGPWAGRRGFDSLVQISTGIAEAVRAATGAEGPGKLPVQALDHAAGHLMAACVLEALARARRGEAWSARVSLARMSHLLQDAGTRGAQGEATGAAREEDHLPEPERTDWGLVRRIRSPLRVEGVAEAWEIPAGDLRVHPPAFP